MEFFTLLFPSSSSDFPFLGTNIVLRTFSEILPSCSYTIFLQSKIQIKFISRVMCLFFIPTKFVHAAVNGGEVTLHTY
jgi:hypothetical protein